MAGYGRVMWLGAKDDTGASLVRGFVGESERQWLHLWRLRSPVTGPEDWMGVINEVALAIPGTLAHRASQDDRMPARFRLVAHSFEALGWQVLDPEGATIQLVEILRTPLLGDGELCTLESAEAAATAFVSLFGENAEFLTNVAEPGGADDIPPKSTDSWATACPLTPAVAEAGVVGTGGGRVGLLWALET